MLFHRDCWTAKVLGRYLRPCMVAALTAAAMRSSAQGTAAEGRLHLQISQLSAAVRAPELLETASAADVLPDAPAPQQSQTDSKQTDNKPLVAATPRTVPATTSMPVAPMYSRIIPAGMAAPQIHGRDKIILAARDLYTPGSIANFVVSAGWDQLTNGQPNYGTNSGAFGQRVGAAAIRDTAQAFLTNGPFAVMLHEDPRYFALGPRYSLVKRTWYAVTRPLVTRSSSDGHAVPNYSLILGQAAGTALNNLYYPKSNRNFHDNVASFGGSMGGAALSFVVDEYTSELWKVLHLKRSK